MAGMKGLTAQMLERGFRTVRQASGAREKALAIERVSQKRVAQMAQMDPNLMGSPSFEAAFNQGRLTGNIKAFHDPVMGYRRSARRTHGHFLAIHRRPAKRRRNHTFATGRLSPHDRLISAFKPAVAPVGSKELAQAFMSRIRLGDNEQAGGILVEAVDDARPADAANAGKAIAAMGDQRVDEGSRVMAGGRMNDEARRLVDDDQVVVLIDDCQAHRFGAGRGIGRFRDRHSYPGGRFDPEARLHYGPPVHLDAPREDQALDARTADFIETLRQQTVETLARVGLLDRDGATGGGFHMQDSSEDVTQALAGRGTAGQDPPNVRVLKYIVIVLGVLLIGCFVAVFALIGYRLANPSKQTGQGTPNELELAIGPNVQLGQVTVEGDRMTVHLKGVAHDELLVIDTRRGRLISKIRLRRAAQF
jgi:Family of unknown function (DUF6476)